MNKVYSAAVLLIGNELLSGRTKDANLSFVAEFLIPHGIQIREARVVQDVQAEIVEALNILRRKYDFVFCTGGIGPTHDDITAEAVAVAFGVEYGLHPEAHQILIDYYKTTDINAARLRMATMPLNAMLVPNPVTGAPGFQIDNVFVMAGVPKIMQGMMHTLAERLPQGAVMHKAEIKTDKKEGDIAQLLKDTETTFPEVQIGSYPHFAEGGFSLTIVLRSLSETHLADAVKQLSSSLS